MDDNKNNIDKYYSSIDNNNINNIKNLINLSSQSDIKILKKNKKNKKNSILMIGNLAKLKNDDIIIDKEKYIECYSN